MSRTPRKKVTRRLKKSVRRSLSAVLMITAIAVAAIPVPETYAGTGRSAARAVGLTPRTDGSYAYADRLDITDSANDDPLEPMNGWGYSKAIGGQGTDWKKEDHKNDTVEQDKGNGIYRTLSITPLNDDTYSLNWRFKFYQVRDNDTNYGVVCDYNNTLAQTENTIMLEASAIYDYELVTQDEYSKFQTDYANTTYELKVEDTLSGNDSSSTSWNANLSQKSVNDSWFFQKYYPDIYTAFMRQQAEYETAIRRYRDWLNSDKKGTAPTWPTVLRPEDLEYKVSGLSDKNMLSYYCDMTYGTTDEECSLQHVIDYRQNTETETRVFIPKFPKGYTPEVNSKISGVDAEGFITKNSTTLMAIGDRAFADTNNAVSMVIDNQIKYIGNEAFKNSFITGITLGNVEVIGNRAFWGCVRLEAVNYGIAIKKIGNEAFYGCTKLTEVVLPDSITLIGGGAFANCSQLTTVDASALRSETPVCAIRDYAFFNDVALKKVDFGTSRSIHTLGKGAFAVDMAVVNPLTEFTFPHGISKVQDTASTKGAYESEGMGDYILAGRSDVQYVVMPKSFGSATKVTIPYYTFYNCNGLKRVAFPAGSTIDSEGTDCGMVSYDEKLFSEVASPDFYVQGPEKDRAQNVASPRTSTWAAKTMVSDTVPYVFYRGGVRHCEICKDQYLVSMDESGVIDSIQPRPGVSIDDPVDLVIESQYGGIDVKGLADGCIDQEILDHLRSLVISDDSIESIGASVFEGCPDLEEVVIGNAVSSIGSRAFANCPKLENVTFNPPIVGYDNFTIGDSAFVTGSKRLMFHGDIVSGYAPFEWAMDPGVYANEREGIRIAYKGLAPSRLLVLLDNSTLLPTLVDYQHYNRIDVDNPDYVQQQFDYYELQASLSANGLDYAAAWEQFKDECAAYNTDVGYSVIKKYEDIYLNGKIPYYDFEQLSPFEEQLIEATRNVVVPEGVKSIDVYGFYNADGTSNNNSIAAYNLSKLQAWPSYVNKYAEPSYSIDGSHATMSGNGDVVPGLFSGNYQDYQTGSELGNRWETETKGNDRIEKISLMGVTRLPDYAFDDCERLIEVTLGPECTDIGASPFRGCTAIENVIFNNDIYSFDNGIIYRANDAGKLTIVTCLSTRGNGNVNTGEPYININTDPKLAQVNEIAVGAFDSCESIANVDLSGADSLTTISRGAFKNCDALSYVTLPKNIARIDEEAFYKDEPTAMSVTVLGKEVSIRNDAFNHTQKVQLRSYQDSAAKRYADTYGLSFVGIDEGWEVNFMDYDGTYLADVQYIEDGKPAAVPDNPIRVGYTFTGWSPTVTGMSTQKITADVTFIAQYSGGAGSGTEGSGGNGQNQNTNNNSSDDDDDDDDIYTVTVINGAGSGTYKKGATVSITANAPATGRSFDRWQTDSLNVSIANVRQMSTSFTMPGNNVVVTAVYDSGSSSNSSSTTGGSSSGSNGTGSGTTSGNGTGSGSNGSGNGTATTSTNGNGNGTAGTSTNNGTSVSITPGIGVSNTGAASATVEGSTDNFVVRITTTPEATAAVERALTNEFGTLDNIRYFPMDITLWDSTGTTQITDTAGLAVNITMPIPDDLIPYAGNNRAGAVGSGDVLEKLGTSFKTIDGIPCINFTATHFSPYTIYVDTQNLTSAIDASPKTGDPIHPKWFLALGLACLSVVLFMKKDKKTVRTAS